MSQVHGMCHMHYPTLKLNATRACGLRYSTDDRAGSMRSMTSADSDAPVPDAAGTDAVYAGGDASVAPDVGVTGRVHAVHVAAAVCMAAACLRVCEAAAVGGVRAGCPGLSCRLLVSLPALLPPATSPTCLSCLVPPATPCVHALAADMS